MGVLVEPDVVPASTAARSSVEAAVHALDDAAALVHVAVDEGLSAGDCERVLAALERHGRRMSALRLKVLSAAGRTAAAQGAGFASTESWVASRTRMPRSAAARQVALANELESGHDVTSRALDEGLVSAAHAAVIVGAARDLPGSTTPVQRDAVERRLVEDSQLLDPDQLRRRARRVLEEIEPDQAAVDAHENELVRDAEEAARDKCALTLHDNGDGTTSGQFTVPTLAAAFLHKVLDAMTAPRRMRLSPDALRSGQEPVTFDWRHRRGLAFAQVLEHLPVDHLHGKTAATVVVTMEDRGAARGAQGGRARHRREHHGRRSPSAGLQRRDHPRRARQRFGRPRSRS